jgi:hypothetical protein
MVQSQRPDPLDAQAFFEALPSNRECAISMLRAQVPDDGPPTPRGAAFIESGEWDSSTLIPIVFISLDPCVGQVGDVTKGEGVCFCGLRLGDCTSRTHLGSVWREFRPGRFIPGGTRIGAGHYHTPSLPSAELGGPITSSIARVLRDPSDPVVLSLGQWKFIIEEWVVGAVASTPSSGEFSFETEPRPKEPKEEDASPDSGGDKSGAKFEKTSDRLENISESETEPEDSKPASSEQRAGPTVDTVDSSDSEDDQKSSREKSFVMSNLTALLTELPVLQGTRSSS